MNLETAAAALRGRCVSLNFLAAYLVASACLVCAAAIASSTIVSEDQTFSSRLVPQLAPGKTHWLRAEVHAPDGSLQLLTNPIYLTAVKGSSTRAGR